MTGSSSDETSIKRRVYFLSNRTAITAETLGQSLLAQFPGTEFLTVSIPFVDTAEKAHDIVSRIKLENERSQLKPIIVATMANLEISQILQGSEATVLDPFERFLPELESLMHQDSIHESGRSHRIANQRLYDSRIDAIDFSIIHDDGGITRSYDEADIILTGVSRSGKTPTCLYLALQFGLKAANYPLTEEDMDSEDLPSPIRPFSDKLFGLTSDATRLSQIRQQRRPESRYASIEQCRREIGIAEQMFGQFRIPYLNTTTISIEEIATTIVATAGLNRINRPVIG